ncbi:MAG: methylated-DNA--[protein]-cysteine S-methyltransferase [Ginsengibacter sp.]
MYYQSPIGLLKINIHNGFIDEVNFYDKENGIITEEVVSAEDGNVLKKCSQQLDEYFAGKRMQFDFPIRQEGTPFQQKVWGELINIPFGKTISYLALSERIGNVKSIRAVGAANGRNNISIAVPCHRVIGSNGSLTGYAGGLWRKQWLLEHENKYANGVNLLF